MSGEAVSGATGGVVWELVECCMNTNKLCPSCGKDYSTGGCGGIGDKTFCIDCYNSHAKKRLERMRRDLAGRDRLSIYWGQIREAMAERDRYRREYEQIKDKMRAEINADIESETVRKIRGMTAWKRFKFLLGSY